MRPNTIFIFIGKLLVAALAFVVGLRSGGIMAMSLGLQPPVLPSGIDTSALTVWMFATSPLFALALYIVNRGLVGGWVAWSAILMLFAWISYSVTNVIEAAIFSSYETAPWFSIVSFLPAVLFGASATAYLFSTRNGDVPLRARWKTYFQQRNSRDWRWRFLAAVVLFMPIYYLFGLMVVPFVGDSYEQGAFGLAAPPLKILLMVLLVRSTLFFIACLPVMVAWQSGRRQLAMSLGFALFVLVGLLYMLAATWIAPRIRFIHSLEILADSLVYAGALVWLMKINPSIEMSKVHKSRFARGYFVRALFMLMLLMSFGSRYVQPILAADATNTGAITSADMQAFFDAMVNRQMADEHVVGATVSVVKDGKLLFAKGYGYADLEQMVPVAAEQTLFYPGSAGKLFTWTALMQLVEQGKLDLTDDIDQYLDFTIPATFSQPITIKHLLTHTAGFEEQLEALLVNRQRDVLPLRDFLVRSLPARVYAPGTTFAYSNYATILAGYIVERVSGEAFEQYVTDHILVPLEMSHSAARQPLPADLMADFSKGYHYQTGQYAVNDFEWIAASPAAPIRTTATDMAKFMIAQLNGGEYGSARILQEATCAAMQQKQFAHDPRVNGVGLGFMVSEQNGQTIVWHTGGSAHFNTMLALIPAQNTGFFISYNKPVTDLYQPLVSFVDHFYPQPTSSQPASTPKQATADTAERIAALSGNYVSSRVAHQSVQKLVGWQSEALTVEPGAGNTLQVGTRTYAEVEPGLFRQLDGPRTLTYRTNDRGEVVQIFWGQFAFFKVPWYQTAGNQLIIAAVSLLLILTAALAWAIDWFVRRLRGIPSSDRWAQSARWTVVLLGLLNGGLFAWFIVALLDFADTFVFPSDTMAIITMLWSINIPAVLALLALSALAWRNHYWHPVWRIHYVVVTIASIAFLWFLVNWNLVAV